MMKRASPNKKMQKMIQMTSWAEMLHFFFPLESITPADGVRSSSRIASFPNGCTYLVLSIRYVNSLRQPEDRIGIGLRMTGSPIRMFLFVTTLVRDDLPDMTGEQSCKVHLPGMAVSYCKVRLYYVTSVRLSLIFFGDIN